MRRTRLTIDHGSRASSGATPVDVVTLLEAVAGRVGVPVGAASRRYARDEVATVKRVTIHAAVALGVTISDAAAVVNVSRQRGSRVAQLRLSPGEQAIVEEVLAGLRGGAGARG